MGAWSAEAFENDTALDFVDDLLEQGFPDHVERVLKEALHPPEPRTSWWQRWLGVKHYYNAAAAFEAALAAAEVVAFWHGQPSAHFPEKLVGWSDNHRSFFTPALLSLAKKVVVQAETASELKDQWEADGNESPEWNAALADLQTRLS